MPCTLLAILIAFFLALNPIGLEVFHASYPFGIALLVIAFILLLFHTFMRAMAWRPLQKAETDIAPHLLEMYRKDPLIRGIDVALRLFPVAAFAIAAGLLFFDTIPKNISLAVWIVLFGIALDCLNTYQKRILSYLNPYTAVDKFKDAAKRSIKEEKEGDLAEWIDGLSEVAIKGIKNSNISLSQHAINETQGIAKNFLDASKSISHVDQDAQTKALGISDKVGYILFFLYQRLELINDKAVDKGFETISSSIISSLGKIAIYAAKFDITLTNYPLHFIGKVSKKASQHDMQDVPLKASFALLEIARSIIKETDITYTELTSPLSSIINHLNEIAKDIFKKDKNSNLSVLTQPLRDLQELFKDEKFANHRDAPVINQRLSEALGEWDALELVLKTIPPIPKVEEEKS